MIEDARNKKLDIIMTKSISRFGRNTLDTIQTLRELKDLDVTVIFDQEHLDTSKEDSEMILTTLAAFAEEENKNRRDNQNWAIKKRLKDGTSEIYSRACFGYTKSDIGELTIDRKQAEIVQNIFTMYLSGMSILGIVKELERQGIKSPTAKINGANEPSTQCSATKNTSVMPLSLKPTVSILPSMREFKIMTILMSSSF